MKIFVYSVIFICLGATGLEGSRDVLLEAYRQNMTSSDYVYIIPWGLKSNFSVVDPWLGDPATDEIAREAFNSAIIVCIQTVFLSFNTQLVFEKFLQIYKAMVYTVQYRIWQVMVYTVLNSRVPYIAVAILC